MTVYTRKRLVGPIVLELQYLGTRTDLIFLHNEVLYPWLGLPRKMIRIRTPEFINGSSPLRDRTKYAIKVWHDVKRIVLRVVFSGQNRTVQIILLRKKTATVDT